MTNEVKVGDVVAWDKVPDGALVRWHWAGHGDEVYFRRHAHVVSRVRTHDGAWCSAGHDDGTFAPTERVTIIALGLTGRESADELRRLAEWRPGTSAEDAAQRLREAEVGREESRFGAWWKGQSQ